MFAAGKSVVDRRPQVRAGAIQCALEPDHQRGERRPELMRDVGAERALPAEQVPELGGKSYFTWRSGGADPRFHNIRAMSNASIVIRRLVVLAATGLCASACSSGSGSTPAPQATSSAAASSPAGAAPAGTETPPPRDIPGTTTSVAFPPAPGQHQVKAPAGCGPTLPPPPG